MSALDELLKKADTGELSNIEWCIYWSDLTNTDEEWTEKPKEAAAELLALRERVAKLEIVADGLAEIVEYDTGDARHGLQSLAKARLAEYEELKETK